MTWNPQARRIRRRWWLFGLALGLATLSCDTGRSPSPTELGDQEFEDIIVELRVAERESAVADSPQVEFERRKQEVLERHGTTEEELGAFAREAARDLERLRAIWDRISTRLRREATVEEPGL